MKQDNKTTNQPLVDNSKEGGIAKLKARIVELEEVLKNLIMVAARETKDLLAWDGAISLDASIDRAKNALKKRNPY